MIIRITGSKWLKRCLASASLAALVAAPSFGQVIINDSFSDGSPLNSGIALESQWFTTSSGSALDDSPAGDTPGTLEFASGSSGRAIHTAFATQTLTNVGDMLFASISFNTPATVGTDENNGFRIGLFNDVNGSLATDISSSTGSPSPLLGDISVVGPPAGTTPGLDGFSAGYDVNDLSGGIAADEVRIRQSVPASGTGRLLTTTSGFNSIADQDAPGDFNGFVGGEDYQVILKLTLNSPTDIEVFTELNDGAGNVLNTTSGIAAATAFDFDFLGISTSGDAFGSSSSLNDPDNGLRLTNTFVEFIPTAVPEPSSMLLLAGLGVLGLARRRK